MKARICEICLNSDMLCMACKKKMDVEKITDGEVKVARAVHSLSKTFKSLDGVTIKRAIEGKNMTIIICEKGDRPKMIGREGMIINRLSKVVGRTLRVVEETNDTKDFVQNLISPVPLLKMNVVYSREGEALKIIIPRGRSIPMPREAMEEIVRLVFGKNLIISSE